MEVEIDWDSLDPKSCSTLRRFGLAPSKNTRFLKTDVNTSTMRDVFLSLDQH